jgi:hypothetical protein
MLDIYKQIINLYAPVIIDKPERIIKFNEPEI